MRLINRIAECVSVVAVALIFASSCANNSQTEQTTQTEVSSEVPIYSNLMDAQSQNEVVQAMKQAGISAESIEDFIVSVRQFNDAVGGSGLVPQGWARLDSILPHYDEAAMLEGWERKHPEFAGFNCRITAFDLLKGFVRVQHLATEAPTTLLFDEESLQHCGRPLLSVEELGAFRSLFASIPTPYVTDTQIHLKSMQDYLRSKGIEFVYRDDETKASLVSVVMHTAIDPEDSALFIGHTGVLIPDNGSLLFVEKLTFQAPYQVTRFANRQDLNDYLMRMYDVEWDQPTAIPLIMENDKLLEGYRPNLFKKK